MAAVRSFNLDNDCSFNVYLFYGETMMKKKISFNPSWDKRNTVPGKNYGVHGVEMIWTLTGSKGAIQWEVFTGWMLKSLRNENPEYYGFESSSVSGAFVAFHSKKPLHKGDSVSQKKCEFLGNKPCYSNMSCMAADEILEILIEKGEDAVWLELEDYYKKTFKVSSMK